MRFRVLGPLVANGATAGETPSAAMPRRVLAMLLLNHDQVVTVNTLIDELWGTTPPKLSRKTVQTYVYQLRKHLDAPGSVSRIESTPLGYRIRVEPGELDLRDFEDLAHRGSAAARDGELTTALDLLRQALKVWRGPVLSDVVLGSRLEPHVAQVEGDRLRLYEKVVDLALSLGDHRDLGPELRKVTSANPLHEGLHAQLMMVLSIAGDRSGALAVFNGLRQRMVDGLGLDPSPRLVELQREILEGAHDLPRPPERPAAFRAPAAPAQLPPDTADFVGRTSEQEQIASLCLPSGGTAPQIVAVAGRAGVGKTALAVHAGHLLRPHFPDGQLFARLGTGADPSAVLSGFLRALGVPPEQVPDVLAEQTSLYRTMTSGRSLLVVLDDVAHVDDVAPLIPAGPGCAAVVTARTGLPGLPGAIVTRLDPLPTADGVDLLRRIVGAGRVEADTPAIREVVELCDNLPLAVRAAAEKLAARPSWTITDLMLRMRSEEHRLQELVTRRLTPSASFEDARLRLAPAYRWAFWRICSIGRTTFTLHDVAETLGVDTASAECPVAELLDAHLLAVAHAAPGDLTTYRVPELIRLHALSHEEMPPGSVVPADVRQWTTQSTPRPSGPISAQRNADGVDATFASAATSSSPPSMTNAWPVT